MPTLPAVAGGPVFDKLAELQNSVGAAGMKAREQGDLASAARGEADRLRTARADVLREQARAVVNGGEPPADVRKRVEALDAQIREAAFRVEEAEARHEAAKDVQAERARDVDRFTGSHAPELLAEVLAVAVQREDAFLAQLEALSANWENYKSLGYGALDRLLKACGERHGIRPSDMIDGALRRFSEECDKGLLIPPAIRAQFEREQSGEEPAPPPKRPVSAEPTGGELSRAAMDRAHREDEEDRRAALVRDVAKTLREGSNGRE